MKKKIWIISLSSVIALTLLATPISVLTIAFGLPSQYDETFLGEMKEKMNLIKETEGSRIILIGGSSVPFGVRSDLIKEQIGMRVIDFGMYASLGTSVMLDLAKARINDGDMIFIMPEQNSQTLSVYYNGQSLWQAMDGHFEDLKYISSSDRQRMIGDMYSFAQSKLGYAINGKPAVDGIYQKSSFNSYGDIKEGLREANEMDSLYDPTQSISFSNSIISDDFIDYMNDFAAYAKTKGATCYYHFAPMNLSAVTGEDTVDEFYDYLNSQIDFEISGNPNDSLMEAGWFYDTNFHLNDSGAIKYTKQLIKDIKLILGDNSRTNVDDPSMPEPKHQEEKDGNNEDEVLFEYSEGENTCTITGYTGQKESVTIPYRHNGKKIISFSPYVFQKNLNLKEIIIQDNITSIYDDSFKNTKKLEKIILQNEKPSSIKIGYALLNGTNANIYVPKACLSKYKVDYNFSNYASRIFAIEE